MAMTDEALMQAVQRGDLAKLGGLFERHHLAVFDFLARMTGSRAIAEDLVQDVFERILKYRATWRGDAPFTAWLFRIARNARADYYRRRVLTAPYTDAMDGEDPAAGPEAQLADENEAARLQRALLGLREDKRELIVLARYREMKYEAIGEMLGVDAATIKVRVHRALKELRDIFLTLESRPSCVVKTSLKSSQTI
jgi:RNA polymerase sigma-70 factor (ECF subfamily)